MGANKTNNSCLRFPFLFVVFQIIGQKFVPTIILTESKCRYLKNFAFVRTWGRFFHFLNKAKGKWSLKVGGQKWSYFHVKNGVTCHNPFTDNLHELLYLRIPISVTLIFTVQCSLLPWVSLLSTLGRFQADWPLVKLSWIKNLFLLLLLSACVAWAEKCL